MTKSEVAKILTLAAAYDQRSISEDDVEAWNLIIGCYRYEDAQRAVLVHFEASRERLMPADICTWIEEQTQQWVWSHPTGVEPPPGFVTKLVRSPAAQKILDDYERELDAGGEIEQ